MKLLVAVLFCLLSVAGAFGQGRCVQTAHEVAPKLSAETQRDFESKLTEARENLEKDPRSVDAVIWLGRRTAYLGNYKAAIKIYTDGIKQFPPDARLYRHRGHRLITLRCFDDAIADFEQAAKLIRNKPDEIEPDGLPNAKNIPTSTLQSNIWYHLGLAYYLKGEFQRALAAYRKAEKVSKNPDMLVATTYWLYLTLRQLNREEDARQTLAAIKSDLEVIENKDYYQLLKVYKGELDPIVVWQQMNERAGYLTNGTLGYGTGMYFLFKGERANAQGVFQQVTAYGAQWASFGYIASEVEQERRR